MFLRGQVGSLGSVRTSVNAEPVRFSSSIGNSRRGSPGPSPWEKNSVNRTGPFLERFNVTLFYDVTFTLDLSHLSTWVPYGVTLPLRKGIGSGGLLSTASEGA